MYKGIKVLVKFEIVIEYNFLVISLLDVTVSTASNNKFVKITISLLAYTKDVRKLIIYLFVYS